jgi:hypothetical protein
MRRLIALSLAAALVLPGCTSLNAHAQTNAYGARARSNAQGVRALADTSALPEFARQLPTGARVRVKVTGGETIRGTLIKTTDVAMIVQPRTRTPEPLIEVPFDRLASIEQETTGSGTGRAIAIGAAAGAGAALGIIMILIAIASD